VDLAPFSQAREGSRRRTGGERQHRIGQIWWPLLLAVLMAASRQLPGRLWAVCRGRDHADSAVRACDSCSRAELTVVGIIGVFMPPHRYTKMQGPLIGIL
jgi:hypothetical protein